MLITVRVNGQINQNEHLHELSSCSSDEVSEGEGLIKMQVKSYKKLLNNPAAAKWS